MKQFVRVLICTLCLMLVFSVLPGQMVFAEKNEEAAGKTEWALEDGVLWISCQGEMDFGEKMPWKKFSDDIISIRFDEGVTAIAEEAFRGCGNLRSVNLPQSLRCVHDGAFQDCESICWVTFPESTIRIGADAFLGCTQLTTVFIPESVSYIGDNAFEPTIFINGYAGSATEDYVKAFGGAFNRIGDHELASASGSCGESVTWVLEKGVMTLEGTGKIEPSADGSYPWEALRADIVAVEIGEGITEIGDGAFEDCRKLTQATVPASVVSLDEDSFGEDVMLLIDSGAESFAEETEALRPEEETAEPVSEDGEEELPEPEETEIQPTREPEAHDPTELPEERADGILAAGQAAALAGQQISVPITLSGSPDIRGLNFRIDYDKTFLTLTDYACTCDGMSAGDWTVGVGEGEKALWFQPEAGIANGEILTLYFAVADNAPEGETPVSLTEVLALDGEQAPVTLEVQSGTVTVREGLKGDVNGDGEVTAADLQRLRRYLAGQNVAVEPANTDLNGDGKMDLTDLLLLNNAIGK